jgi:hypothetical protein
LLETIMNTGEVVNAQDCAEAILGKDGFAVVPEGLCGRILRGVSDDAFETLTDDPSRLLVMTMGPLGLVSLAGKTGYEMLIEIGYEPDYIVRKVEEGNAFKLLVFKAGEQARLATWVNVRALVAEVYSELAEIILHPDMDELASLRFEEIEFEAGYSFAEVDENGPSDHRFMTAERLLASEGRLHDVRAFLYHIVHLRELFTGDGWTRRADGGRGMREYMVENLQVSDLEDAMLVDLDVQLPAEHALRRQIERLHQDAEHALCILHTGSMGDLVKSLWLMPGSSATIESANFCYSREALLDDLGNLRMDAELASYCSEHTARVMAMVVFRKASAYMHRRGSTSQMEMGLGITSVVCSKENLPDGKIECSNIAVVTLRGTYSVFVRLKEAAEDASKRVRLAHRARQGELIDLVALNLLLYAADGVDQVPLDPSWLEWMSSEQFVEQDNGTVIIDPKLN